MPNFYTKYQNNNNDSSYRPDWKVTKDKIFELSEDVKDSYSEYYNMAIDRGKKSDKKLNRLRKNINRLYKEIQSKLEKYNGEDEKKLVKLMNYYSENNTPFSWDFCKFAVNTLINWLEKTGLTKLDIETEDPITQFEKECFGESTKESEAKK
jgi:ElaB/YqjD/DUF883 family membrane-anchored ribosome-binding protein